MVLGGKTKKASFPIRVITRKKEVTMRVPGGKMKKASFPVPVLTRKKRLRLQSKMLKQNQWDLTSI
jgi:hypothetical protein